MNWRNLSADTVLRRPFRRERKASEADYEGRTDSGISSRTDSEWCVHSSTARPTRHGSVISVDDVTMDESSLRKSKLIEILKKEVKVIMSEAASKKQVHLDSPYVSSLCVAVDHCVMDGVRRRFLGLVGHRTSLALIHTIAKTFRPAERVLAKVHEMEGTPSQICWIREALHMRILSAILDHIATCKEIRRVYEEDSLMLDRAKGGMAAALLLGPCAVTFIRMTEPSDSRLEWTERMREPPPQSPHRPPLSIKRQGSSLVSIERQSSSRDYVFSLHANYRTTLLYGKNNVMMSEHEGEESRGYLSLHKQVTGDITLRWTPNQLMHACSQPNSASYTKEDARWTWKQAITIEFNQVIYIHFHQKDDESTSSITFVSCEGVQSPPLIFPSGSQSLHFLSSLEGGLAPLCRLDPPLHTGTSKEKVLPKLRRRTSSGTTHDYVFRIVHLKSEQPDVPQMDDVEPSPPPSPHTNGCISLPSSPAILGNVDNLVSMHVGLACRSMQQQIVGRAFFGWLSYCRHLRTVREHLMGLVDLNAFRGDENIAPVDDEFWNECRTKRTEELRDEFYLRTYWRGIEGTDPKALRAKAWPYLLGIFDWNENPEPKTTAFTDKYREDVEEWRVLEAEVRRRDEETFNAARARKGGTPIRELSMGSDVFDEEESNDEGKDGELLIQRFATNLHRIEKDVERCDRALRFFSNPQNLESLRRIVCTYVRRNLEDGYVQGMCDIVAPLLVIFEDEALTLECYTVLMERMKWNFPQHAGMDRCLSNLRSLIRVMDPQIFDILSASADFTQLYFSYRWFLLDFKRELAYDGVYRVWETIWSSSRLHSQHFPLFFALAMLTNYREAIVENQMDFADLIKFFNDMTSRHDVSRLLSLARGHVRSLHLLLQNIHSR